MQNQPTKEDQDQPEIVGGAWAHFLDTETLAVYEDREVPGCLIIHSLDTIMLEDWETGALELKKQLGVWRFNTQTWEAVRIRCLELRP